MQGSGGKKGGELFVEQLESIFALNPKVVRLEMVPSVETVNDGKELKLVLETLSERYRVHHKVLEMWRYGDPTTRQRLFIVGFHKDHFPRDFTWEWPEGIFDEDKYPTARDIAVPDAEVPSSYWRRPVTDLHQFKFPRALEPGRIQPIGFAGDPERPRDMGPSKNPNWIHSWDGGLSCQLSTNGGSRRPSLAWTEGTPIGRTRLTAPLETCRAASLDEESYIALAKKHFSRKSLGMSFDMWLHELVNLGVPVSTGTALDRQIHKALQSARIESTDHCAERSSLRAFGALHQLDGDPDDGLMYPFDKGSART